MGVLFCFVGVWGWPHRASVDGLATASDALLTTTPCTCIRNVDERQSTSHKRDAAQERVKAGAQARVCEEEGDDAVQDDQEGANAKRPNLAHFAQ